jgi:D-inositol-3-phosphate glycosyltransferase
LVPPRDPVAIARAVRSLLDSPEQRAAFGRAGRERALAHYTWDRVAATTAQTYTRVMAARVAADESVITPG